MLSALATPGNLCCATGAATPACAYSDYDKVHLKHQTYIQAAKNCSSLNRIVLWFKVLVNTIGRPPQNRWPIPVDPLLPGACSPKVNDIQVKTIKLQQL